MSGRRNASRRRAGRRAEQGDLAALLLLRRRLRAAQDRLGRREQPRAVRLQRIEGAGADQVLELHAVELARIDAGGEVGEVGERRSPRASASACMAANPTFFTAASA